MFPVGEKCFSNLMRIPWGIFWHLEIDEIFETSAGLGMFIVISENGTKMGQYENLRQFDPD